MLAGRIRLPAITGLSWLAQADPAGRADRTDHRIGETMPKVAVRRAATVLALTGLAGMLGCASAGASLAATARPAPAVAAVAAVSPDYSCYFPITGFYCYAQTKDGNAPLFNPSGGLYTQLPLNDKVKVTCWYYGNPPKPWLGDGYLDHVTWENIAHPITGHIPDPYVNLDGQVPWQAGIPQC